jgi:hypothetical protein
METNLSEKEPEMDTGTTSLFLLSYYLVRSELGSDL